MIVPESPFWRRELILVPTITASWTRLNDSVPEKGHQIHFCSLFLGDLYDQGGAPGISLKIK